jgi:hypothetical protein
METRSCGEGAMSTPATLPANFFEGKTGPPQTLPADFDFKKGEAPKPDTSPLRGAAQAAGLSADTRNQAGRLWDEIKRGLTSAQPGQGLKPQPTMTANIAQFAGMTADTLAQYGIAPPAAEAGAAAERMVRGFFTPKKQVERVATGILDAHGDQIMKTVETLGKSKAEELLKSAVGKWIRRALTSVGGGELAYHAAKKMGAPLP